MEKSKERKETEKNRLVFRKSSTFEFRRKIDCLRGFWIFEQFMMDTFLFKITQFEKTGSIGKTYISLGNLRINFIFEIRSRSRFS